MQRSIDLFFSLIILIVLSPLLLPVILILKFTGEGEVFFAQKRIGLNGKPIWIKKFATMLKNSPNEGSGTVTLKNDPRILPTGRLLRKTKINELPQIINIFKGEMSFIGPRPQTQRCFEAFPKESQVTITEVLPGLSGIGSLIFRNEEEMLHGQHNGIYFYDNIIMPYKGRLEEWYVRNQSLKTYLLLIIITLWVLLVKKSRLPWLIFKDLPKPPNELTGYL
jgi:lipopolysaccharide/colanic/teichoic acid biosynthesis glycosyltransferase